MHSDGLVRQIYVSLYSLAYEAGWTEADVALAVRETAKLLPEASDLDTLQKAVESQLGRSPGGGPKVNSEGLGGIATAAALIGLDMKGIEPAVAGVRAAIASAVQTRKSNAARDAVAGPLSDAWKAPLKVGGDPLFSREAGESIYRMAGDAGLQARMGFAPGGLLRDALDNIVPQRGGLGSMLGAPPENLKKLTLVKLPLAGLTTGDVALALAQLSHTLKGMGRDSLSMAVHGHPEYSRSMYSVTQKAFKERGAVNGDVLELGFTIDPQELANHGYGGKEAEVERFVTAAFEKLRSEMAKGVAASNIAL